MSNNFKRTKILATLGPATNSPEMIDKLVQAGVNGFRFNFSHGSHEERIEQIKWVREASNKYNTPVAVLQDLQGPKIRLGMLNGELAVKAGDILTLDYAAEHSDKILPVQYNLATKVKPGEIIYIFDGKVKTIVEDISSETAIRVRVENDGVLSSKKGINLPDTDFSGDILTEKDIKDIEFGATQDIDYVALSFVQSADDINNLRQILLANGSDARIISKVETKAAIQEEALKEIVKASDGVMVARGDLAVEAGAEIVPIVQRRIISLCRRYERLCIVATQMMASMVNAPEPTRAEVSDVANAVIQGTDIVMLSDETANGSYPIETVNAMRKVILYTQDHAPVQPIEPELGEKMRRQHAISAAAVQIAETVSAKAIIATTKSGATAANISAYRPNLPIISVSYDVKVAQKLALGYANQNFVRPSGEDAGYEMAQELYKDGYFGEGKVTVVIVSGSQSGVAGTTDTIKVRHLE